MKNKVNKRIYDIIMDDIHSSDTKFSQITTAQVGKLVGDHVSINSIRDKIQLLIKKGYFNGEYELWINNKYHNRVIYAGNVTPE
jgi:hypothetical protein